MVADGAEPDPRRGRELRRRACRARPGEGRPLPAPRRGPADEGVRPGDARDDLALGHAALATPPDEGARAERDVDAVVVFTVPMAHFRGIPTYLRERFGVPVVFDGDVPMSLPEFGGMDTGFNYYHGADLSEYDLVVSNSEGGLERLRELGARRAEAVSAPTPSSLPAGSRSCTTSSSTATATSSGATGWRPWSESRAAPRPSSSSRSAAGTSRATRAAPG